ncbi:hypothetical protein VP01_3550g1 [Puccinia sorghi]|uniref:HAT C-terminal dimerisation domain-containing protein n=1 Tax=Puccinia sorghi TaxID=27349 RepID=A0A0L6UVI7_9BASI|nr:hypothetical protein VP01_3550g1 [Puccinia sorghi]
MTLAISKTNVAILRVNNPEKKKTAATNRNKFNKLNELTQNVCILFCLSLDLLHGNRTLKTKCAYNTREVSCSLKKTKSGHWLHYQIRLSMQCSVMSLSNSKIEFQDKTNRMLLGHFKEIQFTQANWMQIKHLNKELKPFNFLTNEIEVDGPNSAFFLANYYQKIKDLKNKEIAEALECEALKDKRILNYFWRRISTSKRHNLRKARRIFKELEKETPKIDNDNIYSKPAAKDQKSLLIWWKDHSKTFPVLLNLAKDYLSSSASSCDSDQTFSSEADVCSSGHGSLKPQKIERCVKKLKKYNTY